MLRLSFLVLCALAAPCAHAAFTSYFKGTVFEGGKYVPATGTMSYTDDRVAMGMSSVKHHYRMIFEVKGDLLTVVDDGNQTYVEMQGGVANAMDAAMKAQLDRMPPEQRKMAEQMMQNMRGMTAQRGVPDTYVWTTDTETRKGYKCTWVMVMQGNVKRAAYCGTISPDFVMTATERAGAVGFAHALGNSSILARDNERSSQMRMFEWNSEKDGYPLVSRCFNGDKIVLDLELDSFNHEKPPKELFDVPAGYRKLSFGPP
jgi:hypothetical protein